MKNTETRLYCINQGDAETKKKRRERKGNKYVKRLSLLNVSNNGVLRGIRVSGLYPSSSVKKEYSVSEIGFISVFK
jgi:hypothetical protein